MSVSYTYFLWPVILLSVSFSVVCGKKKTGHSGKMVEKSEKNGEKRTLRCVYNMHPEEITIHQKNVHVSQLLAHRASGNYKAAREKKNKISMDEIRQTHSFTFYMLASFSFRTYARLLFLSLQMNEWMNECQEKMCTFLNGIHIIRQMELDCLEWLLHMDME